MPPRQRRLQEEVAGGSWLPLRNWLRASSRNVFPLGLLSLGQDSAIDIERAARDGFVSRSKREYTKGVRNILAATLAAIVGRNMRESSGQRTHPSLQDYGLALGNPALALHVALCAAPSPGARREAYDGGNWFASLSPDRMIEGNGVDTVLVYQRITDKTPVEASFPCTGSLRDARQAICRSQSLAGLDRSVGLAYERARKRTRGVAADLQKLEREQTAWQAARDRCKTDENCLLASMNDRIGDLMQQ